MLPGHRGNIGGLVSDHGSDAYLTAVTGYDLEHKANLWQYGTQITVPVLKLMGFGLTGATVAQQGLQNALKLVDAAGANFDGLLAMIR
ncbi:MAG: hypothetical protein FJW30_06605 [Acidobacteria bacterium]|nr:hypothetical protein [Acidobacteriota bacterium]